MNRLICSLCLACAGLFAAGLAQAETPRIDGKTFTEQRILTAITAQFLQERGYDVTVTIGLGGTLACAAQESGQLDTVWEYTGSSPIVCNHINEKLDAAVSYRRVKQLDEAQGLVWLKLTRFNSTYVLTMPEEQVECLGIQSASDLARVLAEQQEVESGSTHLFVMDSEFAGRPDGLSPISELHGLYFARNDICQMNAGLVYTALKNRQAFLGLVYTTDGRLKGLKLCMPKDDKQYLPFYDATPMMRKEVMQHHPELATLLDPIIERLDDATMQALSMRVDIEQQTPQKVAADFLRKHRLLDDGQADQGGSR